MLVDNLKLFWVFFFDTLPHQIYLYFLFCLPTFYFSQVVHIFEEVDMTMEEIKGMAFSALWNQMLLHLTRTIPALT